MRKDRLILLLLAVVPVIFSSGDSGCNPPLAIATALPGYFYPPVIDVCKANSFGYTRQSYLLGPGGWSPVGDPTVNNNLTPPPDDCIHSGDFSGLENAAAAMSTAMMTSMMQQLPLPKLKADAATPAPKYPASDQPAYAKNLPVPPLFSIAAWQNVTPHCDPNQSYYTVNHGNGTVTHFGTCPLHKMVTIPVRTRPLEAVLSPDAKLLLVTSFDGAVNFIDTSTDQVAFTLSTPGISPSGVAISPDGARAYVTNYNDPGSLVFVDIAGRKISSSIPLPGYPRNLFVTPDGSQVWVNFLASNTIYIIDTLTSSVASVFTVNGTAEAGIAFNPTGTRAYIAVRPGSVAVIDTATLTLVSSVPVGSLPVDVLVTQDGKRILVDDFSSKGTLTAIDATTNTVISSLDTGAPNSGMVLYPQVP